ncbi:MAG: ROK family protein, partial [Clostridium sp.]|nr:ROK family protein [Clostridium sp.]
NISCICNPEVFVIGGGVSKAGDILIDKTKQYYIENAFHATVDTKFKVATLGNDAGIFGGAKLSLEI